jgi:C-terminal processing protease CtpA/Prc
MEDGGVKNPFTGKPTNVLNDAFTRANRAARRAGATDRIVEIRQPLGMELDEDAAGNVYVKKLTKGGRAEKTGMVFEGDIIAMVSATFGDDMWSARGVGLDRVVKSIQVRNTKPVKLALEARNEQEEKKRQAIAFKELTEAEKAAKQQRDDDLLAAMQEDDKSLRKKRTGFLGLW